MCFGCGGSCVRSCGLATFFDTGTIAAVLCCGELPCLPLRVPLDLSTIRRCILYPSPTSLTLQTSNPPLLPSFNHLCPPPRFPQNTHDTLPARTTRSSKSERRTPTTLATSTSASSASAVSSRGASPTGRRPRSRIRSSVREGKSGRRGCSTPPPRTATRVSSTCSLFFQSGSSFDSACSWFSGFARLARRGTIFAAHRDGRSNTSRDSHRRWQPWDADMLAHSSPMSPR